MHCGFDRIPSIVTCAQVLRMLDLDERHVGVALAEQRDLLASSGDQFLLCGRCAVERLLRQLDQCIGRER